MILKALRNKNIILMIDGTKVGPGSICLMLSIYYKGRALPLCWAVYKGKKGHSTCDLQLKLIKSVLKRLDEGVRVVLLGDGEFDSSGLIEWLENQPTWQYVCRTATNIKVFYNNQWIELSELPLVKEEEAFFEQLLFTKTAKVGPVNILAIWNDDEKRHWFMVTNVTGRTSAKKWYRFRYYIETFFSDVKRRGFDLDRTRLSSPTRVNRLILVVAIVYIFTISCGIDAIIRGCAAELCRQGDSLNNRYYSLFQIGLMYIDHLLNESLPFPVDPQILPPDLVNY